jgi:hypothetical protein
MSVPESTVKAISDFPLTGESLVEIRNEFGSKVITVDRLIEITPWDPETVEEGAAEFMRNVDREIRRDN